MRQRSLPQADDPFSEADLASLRICSSNPNSHELSSPSDGQVGIDVAAMPAPRLCWLHLFSLLGRTTVTRSSVSDLKLLSSACRKQWHITRGR